MKRFVFSIIALLSVACAQKAFNDGQFVVNSQIQAGTYRSNVKADNCYWERLSDFTGKPTGRITNDLASGPQVVSILKTDKGFKSQRCAPWTPATKRITNSVNASFGDGTFVVGLDIFAGTWVSENVSKGCYWERLSAFEGTSEARITNDIGEGQMIVEIAADDVGFKSQRCGKWTKR